MKSDRQLQQDVIDELQWEPAVEATSIGVEVKDGIVTLAGHVQNYAQKVAAEHAAQRVGGVKGVVIEISIALPGASKRSDVDIARAASHALEWNSTVPRNAVKISVQDGWVTLSGEVSWAFQRWAAVAAVRNLIGVAGVNDLIAIKPSIEPHVAPRDIKTKIEAALQRRAHEETKSIEVGVAGDSVTLSGIVASWAERDAARKAAWGAPGVKNVIDNIRVIA